MRAILFTDPHRGYNNNTSKIQDKVFAGIDQSLFDIIIVSGDWGVANIKHVRSSFKAFRRAFPKKKIIGVTGNHDLWDKKIKGINDKQYLIKKYAEESQIHLLENNPFEKDGVVFLGFNGWYHYPHPDTRDSEYMIQYVDGQTVDNYLRSLADKAIYSIIDYPKEGKKVVCVTHFPCVVEAMDNPFWNGNPRHGDILLEFSDVLIFGHTHQSYDNVIGKTRVINVGSDYNKLEYKIIDIK